MDYRDAVHHILDKTNEETSDGSTMTMRLEQFLSAATEYTLQRFPGFQYDATVLVLAGMFEACLQRFVLSLPSDQKLIAEEARAQTLQRLKAATVLPITDEGN